MTAGPLLQPQDTLPKSTRDLAYCCETGAYSPPEQYQPPNKNGIGVILQVITQHNFIILHQTQPVQRPAPFIDQFTRLRAAAATENLIDCFSQIWVRVGAKPKPSLVY
ncbi:hypothetical protein PHAVU_001G134200 [Phaseolus vulgaris]|uniref:Uncharacterized protein n=1 Tax=Phaseolus vulgaris TaxID=3885 RepID=V7CY69_PHAVU|nr:hypothetical protein PHAVU_001G134200g [Phaseolus vulgaris]ESW34215.1 hypothetical protein PHAVU_001G134200g [Phaseolus vulgaris]